MESGHHLPEGMPEHGAHAGHFSIAFNGTRDMMVLFRVEPGPTLRLLAANTSYMVTLSQLGFDVTSKDLVGRTLDEICARLAFPAPAARRLIDRYLEVARSGVPLSFEERTETPRGPHYGETVLTPVPDATGRCTHVLYSARDITDRKLAEQALRESEVRLRQTFRATPVPMVIVDLESGRIVDGNIRSVNLFGFAESDRLSDLWVNPEEGERVLSLLRERKALSDQEYRLKDAAKGIRACLVSMEAIELSGASGAVVAFHDVTRQREMERERAALEARLAQSQKLEALGTLAGGIAHDFNNILTAIVAYSDLTLLDADEPTLVREYAGEMRKASDRAKELAGRILAFGRKTQPERRPLALAAVVHEASKLLRSSLPTSIEILCEVDEQAPRILADPTQIHQIVMNLGTNSAHAMVGVPGTLKIQLCAVELAEPSREDVPGLKPGTFVMLEVSDSGHGMDDEVRSRLFDPFFTTKPEGEGTGLGLAVVQGIVRECGGAIAVRSRPGEGARFRLYFPAFDSVREVLPSVESAPPLGQGEHVLLLDDELSVGESARLLLLRLGYRVSAFSNPLDAMAAFKRAPDTFALVITDLTMPKMSGLDFAQEVLRERPTMPIFLASGFSGALTTERARALGVRELLSKPFSLETLAVKIRVALATTT